MAERAPDFAWITVDFGSAIVNCLILALLDVIDAPDELRTVHLLERRALCERDYCSSMGQSSHFLLETRNRANHLLIRQLHEREHRLRRAETEIYSRTRKMHLEFDDTVAQIRQMANRLVLNIRVRV